MVNKAKQKGSGGEYEAIKLIQPVVDTAYSQAGLIPPVLQRNLEQTRAGGHDIIGLPWLALEIKRQETLNINAWWNQTLASAIQSGGEPVLMYRQNNKKWHIMMHGYLDSGGPRIKAVVQISLDAFLIYIHHRIKAHLQAMPAPN
jgi:hypothetical protein